MTVSFAETPAKTMEVTRLLSMRPNSKIPGTGRHVTRITVTLPAGRLLMASRLSIRRVSARWRRAGRLKRSVICRSAILELS